MARVSIVRALAGVALLAALAHAGPRAPWSGVPKKIAIQSGLGVSAWDAPERANITGGLVNMTAVGDGTYEYIVALQIGTTYNFALFAEPGSPPPSGLQAGTRYYDTVPGAGTFLTSTSSTAVAGPQVARFDGAGPQVDARRVLYVAPGAVSAGTTIYVFNNFASTPSAPAEVKAQPAGPTSVYVYWSAPYGAWGSGGENMKAADVIAGGLYILLVSTNAAGGPYTELARVDGSTFGYVHTGLAAGNTYYYVARSSDAYTGGSGQADIQNMVSPTSSSTGTATGRAATPTYWKVEGIDLDYVERHGYLVWLTPDAEEPWRDRPRIPGRITWSFLP